MQFKVQYAINHCINMTASYAYSYQKYYVDIETRACKISRRIMIWQGVQLILHTWNEFSYPIYILYFLVHHFKFIITSQPIYLVILSFWLI